MSGFLTRMAERALGHAQVATPRVPSRFDPLPEESGVAALAQPPLPGVSTEPDDDAAVADSPLQVPTITQFETVAEATSAIAPGIGVAPTPPASTAIVNPPSVAGTAPAVRRRIAPDSASHTSTVGSSHDRSGSAVAPRSVDPVGPAESADRPRSQSQMPSVPLRRGTVSPSAKAVPPNASPQTVHADAAPSPADFPVPAVSAPPPARASTGRSRPPNPDMEPVPAAGRDGWPDGTRSSLLTAMLGGADQPQARIVAATTAASILPDQRLHRQGQTALAEAAVQQVVEIHIGSVEIRATAPSPPAAAPAASETRSLDAYLAGGRRG